MFSNTGAAIGGPNNTLNNTLSNTLNNALDLFPSTRTPDAAQTKLRRLLYNATGNTRGPTEIQLTLSLSLYDDAVEYMSTLDMNRAASYTFGHRNSYGLDGMSSNDIGGGTLGESVAEEMWELLVDLTLSRYAQHSVLGLTKTVHLIHHVLLHGSESCVTNGELLYRIEAASVPLRSLNTALDEQRAVERILNNEGRASGLENDLVLNFEGISQQLAQFGTRATAAMVKLRGGSVDRGHPVRVAATKLCDLIGDRNNLMRMRMQQAAGGGEGNRFAPSLVPIGSAKQVGYITDEGRLRLLQQKMAAEEKALKHKQMKEQQRLKQARSNLAGVSAVDSFGGGYAPNSGGKVVVGAANSLEDMIRSARYELEQHKSRQEQKISALNKGYSDDPTARARKLGELQRDSVEADPEYAKKEQALKEALEYLEEMQRSEQEKAGSLLDGDFLGDAPAGRAVERDQIDGADLLGFGNSHTPTEDVFGGGAPPLMANSNAGSGVGGGGTADLLGFDGFPGGNSHTSTLAGTHTVQSETANSPPPGRMMSTHNSHAPEGGIMSIGGNFELRPSLVTGMGNSTQRNVRNPTGAPLPQPQQAPSSAVPSFNGIENNVPSMGAMGGGKGTTISSRLPEADEEADAERSRKMQMAAGLFAGVVQNDPMRAAPQKKLIMQSGNNSNVPELDELIPISDTTLAPMSSAADANLNGTSKTFSMPSSDTFQMGPPVGGNSSAGIPPPPPMAPPPPPTEPPPPPPPSTSVTSAPDTVNNLLSNNPSVEQMQEMIRQQQEQMNQMMQAMQQMQMQGMGGANVNGPGGWPPSS